MSSSTPESHDRHDSPDDHGTTPSDAELIETSCTGDTNAYATLFARHEHAIRRMAECLLGRTAEDLVLFAYTHGFDSLRSGDGPSAALRPFLLQAMMRHCAAAEPDSPPGPTENQTWNELYEQANLAYRLVAQNTYPVSVTRLGEDQPREHGGDHDRDPDDEHQAALDAAVDAAVLTMFDELADDWRLVIWHSEIEQDSPDTLALLLGVRTDEAYVLRHRARHTMRQFAVSQYLAAARPARCRYAVDRLDSYGNGELEPLEAERVAGHLTACPDCAMLYEQVSAIAARLPRIVAQGMLGEHTDSYLDRTTKQSRGPGWAAMRWSRLRTALGPRSRGRTLGAVGVVTTVVLGVTGGMALLEPDISTRPTPALDATPWTPWELPVWPSSYQADDEQNDGGGGERARTSSDGSSNESRGGLWIPNDSDRGTSGAGSGSDGSTEPSTPNEPTVPPSSPDDPSTPPSSPPPSDDPTTPPPSDDPTSTPTDDPTGTPTDDPTGGPTDDPTDDPTGDPTDDPTDDPTGTPTDSPEPSFLSA